MFGRRVSSQGCAKAPALRARPRQGGRAVLAHAKKADGPRLAIVGITGAVGQEFLRVRCSSGRGLHAHLHLARGSKLV